MTRRLLILTSVFAVLAAACTNLPKPNVELGSGVRFVPTVADSIDNVGLGNAVAVNADGQPFLSYFGFKAAPKPNAIPIPRPVGSPNVPGVLVTTEKDGLWTHGAAAMFGAGPPGLTVPFGPVEVKNEDTLTPTSSNGTDIAVDSSGGLHVVWTDGAGVWYAGGSSSFAADNVFPSKTTASQVSPFGWPSVAVDPNGVAWVAATVDDGTTQAVRVIEDAGGKDIDQEVAKLDTCITSCPEPQRVAIAFSGDTPVVAYVDARHRSVVEAWSSHGNWTYQNVETGVEASGLAMASDAKGDLHLTYYAGSEVHLATAPTADGSWSVAKVGDSGTPPPSSLSSARTTGVAVDDKNTVYISWFNRTDNTVELDSTTDEKSFISIDTLDTVGGQQPDVAVSSDGSSVFLSWYDPTSQDMLLGMYGSIGKLEVANPSPVPTVGGAAGPTTCQPSGTKLAIDAPPGAATGGFSTTCLAVDAGQSFKVTFNNNDPGQIHNFSVYTDSSATKQLLSTGDPATGPTVENASSNGLQPGTYFFRCDVHTTTMTGTFDVVGKK